MTRFEWIMVALTAAYTIGTFLLWRTTWRSLQTTQALMRLTLLVEYYRSQEPAPNVGHGWESREVPQKIEALRAKQAAAIRQAFPEVVDLARNLQGPDKPN